MRKVSWCNDTNGWLSYMQHCLCYALQQSEIKCVFCRINGECDQVRGIVRIVEI